MRLDFDEFNSRIVETYMDGIFRASDREALQTHPELLELRQSCAFARYIQDDKFTRG